MHMLKVNCHGRARFFALSTSLPMPGHRHQRLRSPGCALRDSARVRLRLYK